MPSLSFHDKQHVLRLLNQQGQIKRIFDDFTRRSGLILTKWTEQSADNVWIRNAVLEKQVDNLLEELHDDILTNINENTTAAWEASNLKNDDLVNSFINDLAISDIVGKSASDKIQQGMFARNMDAFKAFQQRKIDGLTLSDTVWKSVEGAKENLEYYLSSGISTGRPAAIISQDIRQLLQDPDKRFRRVRNEDGKLVLSKPMQDYHPGQGVYRSSYKNALRTAATETNMAYHTADHERWKNQGFVIGIQVSRSKNNKGPCSICDAMVGRYPKDYKFLGNHPWCICQAVPVMLEGGEFIDYLLTGKVPEDKIIKTAPQSAIDFVNDKEANKNRLFAKDNEKYLLTPKSKLDEFTKALAKSNIDYNEVKLHRNIPSEQEIISRVGGGDLTKGSCSSLAFAYAGNKCGFDVLDYRDGASRQKFSQTGTIIDIAEKVGGIVSKNTNDFSNANSLIKNVVAGKEYYFTCGSHAAIIRKGGAGYEYLELQSATQNGFKPLTGMELKQRFGAKKTHTLDRKTYEAKSCIIDIDLLKKDDSFRKLLGYINTAEGKQVKGKKGSIR